MDSWMYFTGKMLTLIWIMVCVECVETKGSSLWFKSNFYFIFYIVEQVIICTLQNKKVLDVCEFLFTYM